MIHGRSVGSVDASVQTVKTAGVCPLDAADAGAFDQLPFRSSSTPSLRATSDVAAWLRENGGRAKTSMRRLALELGRSSAGVHIEVGRLVAAGVLTALPSARGTVLTLSGRPN